MCADVSALVMNPMEEMREPLSQTSGPCQVDLKQSTAFQASFIDVSELHHLF